MYYFYLFSEISPSSTYVIQNSINMLPYWVRYHNMGKIYTNTPIQFLQISPMRKGMNNQKIALVVVDV